ncbi:c-type cytochrome [Roseibium suaedae]|uniref:Cytochrome c n=1 Tax=Roseibium suaedae TaxID=735517 RepID=A0A1M7AIY4_9HYPH|nr:cytochrome c family protein [Roseibium suaedae]SHL42714.1 cytochrome c [Roseibium suaedae]
MKRMMMVAGAVLALTTHAFADGDAAKGEKVFKKCAACHAVGEGAKNKVGPELNGIVGRTTASVADYKYSPAMKEKGDEGHVWTAEELDTYLANPKGMVPKTKMAFAGLKKEDERADVIAYLKTFGADGKAQ